jgi:hypothetical protein
LADSASCQEYELTQGFKSQKEFIGAQN